MINKDRLLKTFLDLVKIDSPSGHEEKMAREVASRLKRLGASVEFDNFGNVIGKFDGEGAGILLNSHLDTVEPGRGIRPHIDGDFTKSDGTTILGGDAKAGVSAIFEGLQAVKESKVTHVPIEVVFTLGEETGLSGAVNLDYSKVSAKRGVTFDGDDNVGNITVSAPGYTRVDFTITGKAAHAGMDPEKGISAVAIAAEIILKLQLGRIDEETTTNIGLIEGGSARNAVPEIVIIKGEVRSRDSKKLEEQTLLFGQVINQVVASHPGADVNLELVREFNPYVFHEDHPVIQLTKKILHSLSIEPMLTSSGGGTDVNIFHTHGIEAICVGTGSHNAHTTREYVQISQLIQTAEFCVKLITS